MSEQKTEWAAKIAAWSSSGLSIAAWCRENSEGYHRFLYWRERLQSPSPPVPGKFVAVNLPTSPISLECKGILVHVATGFDAGLLRDILSLLKGG